MVFRVSRICESDHLLLLDPARRVANAGLHMTARSVSSIVAFFAVLFLLGGAQFLSAQEGKQVQPPSPGPEHKIISKLIGKWEVKQHFRMTPEQPFMESHGTDISRSGPGGLWLVSDYTAEFIGQKFVGHGTLGYDPIKKKYVGTWIDSMSTGLNVYEGTHDEKTNTINYTHRATDPQTGKEMTYRSKIVIADNDHYTMSMYMKAPDGREFESLRLDYSRKGSRKAAPSVVGSWVMLVNYPGADKGTDYELRISREGDKLSALLVSPRSGEHQCKSVTLKGNAVKVTIVRIYDGTSIEIAFDAKLSDGMLSGEFAAEGFDQLIGTWSAKKRKK